MKKKKSIQISLLLATLFFTQKLAAQKFPEHNEEPKTDLRGFAKNSPGLLAHIAYGFHFAGGDLADRFGNAGTFGGGVDFLTQKNFFVGADGHYLFGTKVKEDPLAILRTDSFLIVGNNEAPAGIVLRERGFYVGGHIGKLFTFGGTNRAGLRLSLGAGVLQHWIRLQDDQKSLTQLTGSYRKGYDRRVRGLALNQFAGYQFLGNSRTVNFFAGLEFNQGFTETVRDWDFSSKKKLEGRRLDLRYGFRVGWTLPFYFRKSEQIFY